MFFSRLCVARAFSRNKYALGHHSSAQKREWPWTVITFLNGVKGRYNSKNGHQNCSNPPELETEYGQTAQRKGDSEILRSLSARRVTFIADGQDIYTFNATDSEGKTVSLSEILNGLNGSDDVASNDISEDNVASVTVSPETSGVTVGEGNSVIIPESFVGSATLTLNLTEGDPVDITIQGRVQLTITAASESKVYDGTPHTNNGYTNTSLAGEDTIDSVTVTGRQTVAGSSDNVPSAAKIVDKDGADVTDHYAIQYVNGTLTIELSTSPEIVTDDDFKENNNGKPTGNYKENMQVSNHTYIYATSNSEGSRFWLRIADGSPVVPTENQDGWLEITGMLAATITPVDNG